MSRSDTAISEEPRADFETRLRARLADPANLAVPLVIGLFCLIRSWNLIADIPYWVIAVLMVTALVVNSVNVALWGDCTNGWRLQVRVAVEMAVIGLVTYGIGWGAILAIGFVFGAVDVMRGAGSAAAKPAIIWTVACIGVGQLSIALGAPTLIHQPLVDSLSALAAIGAVLTIMVLQWFASARETGEERFEALVHEASDIIIVSDTNGKLTYVSPAFGRILGVSAGDFGYRSAVEMMHPDDLHHMQGRSREIRASDRNGMGAEVRLRHADGSWKWFEVKVSNHLENPKVRGIVGNLHDITDRKRAEEELRAAHERFRSAFENAPIGIIMADLDGSITSANPALGRILGYDVTDLFGRTLRSFTHPDDRELTTTEMDRLVSSDADGYRLETRFCHALGHDVWVSVNVSCVRDEDSTAPLRHRADRGRHRGEGTARAPGLCRHPRLAHDVAQPGAVHGPPRGGPAPAVEITPSGGRDLPRPRPVQARQRQPRPRRRRRGAAGRGRTVEQRDAGQRHPGPVRRRRVHRPVRRGQRRG